jgi:hypothetical protein
MWDTEHLIDAANQWEQAADRLESVPAQVWQSAAGLDWQGAANDAMRNRTHADAKAGMSKADLLRGASKVARQGAGDIDTAKRAVLYKADDAHDAGFVVGEDYSVTDTRTTRNPAELAQRQAQAQAFSADLRSRAGQLAAVDGEVTTNLTNAAAGIGNTQFQEQPITGPDDAIIGDHDHKARPVDNGPQPSPTPTPTLPPDWGKMQQQLQEQQKILEQQGHQIQDLQGKLAEQHNPTWAGFGAAAGTGCLGGAAGTMEFGPAAIPACVVGGSVTGLAYLLTKIWE